MYLIFPVLVIVIVTVTVLLQCLSCSFGQNYKANIADMHYDSPCGNTRIEYTNNSGLLEPKTEFKSNLKQYRNLKILDFGRSNFSKIKIEIFSTT